MNELLLSSTSIASVKLIGQIINLKRNGNKGSMKFHHLYGPFPRHQHRVSTIMTTVFTIPVIKQHHQPILRNIKYIIIIEVKKAFAM